MMTDYEICESYRRAKFPHIQIGILSELTLYPKEKIIGILESAGFTVKKNNPKRYTKWTDERKRQLIFLKESGKTYKEIAKILGCSKSDAGFYYNRIKKEGAQNE